MAKSSHKNTEYTEYSVYRDLLTNQSKLTVLNIHINPPALQIPICIY